MAARNGSAALIAGSVRSGRDEISRSRAVDSPTSARITGNIRKTSGREVAEPLRAQTARDGHERHEADDY